MACGHGRAFVCLGGLQMIRGDLTPDITYELIDQEDREFVVCHGFVSIEHEGGLIIQRQFGSRPS